MSSDASPLARGRALAARTSLCSVVAVLLACNPAENRIERSDSAPPNVLLILADDLGFHDVGVYGNPEAGTPNIDAFAESGTRFTRFYTAGDTCAPTRASVLTGLYPQRLGFDATPRALPEEVRTLPELLREAGYSTHHIGKWHLGVVPVAQPQAHGFDSFYGFLHARRLTKRGLPSYWDPHLVTGEESPRPSQGHLTELLTDRAVETIRSSVGGQPWFLNLWYFAPHEPVEPPEHWAGEHPADAAGRYRALIAALDEGVGRVLDALEETDQVRRTIVLFLSDNGARDAENNLPFFGAKTRLFEGGVRVPLLLRVPGRVAVPSVDSAVISMDLLPTVAALAGVELPDPVDGLDLAPLLDGGNASLPARSLFWEATPYVLPAAAGLQPTPMAPGTGTPGALAFSVLSADGRWRLTQDQGAALFDLTRDPSGRQNVWRDHPAIANALTEEYRAWTRKVRRLPVRVSVLGAARWDGQQADFSGQGRVDLSGYDVLRTPGVGAWTFAAGVIPGRPPGAREVIAAQSGVWSVERSKRGLLLRMGDLRLRTPAALPEGECSTLSVSTLHRSAANGANPAGSVELRVDGVIVASGQTPLDVPGLVMERPTTLGNRQDGARSFHGALLNPTLWNVVTRSFISPAASRSLCSVAAETAAARIEP